MPLHRPSPIIYISLAANYRSGAPSLSPSPSLLSVGAITVVDATRVVTVRKWRVECLQSAGLVRK